MDNGPEYVSGLLTAWNEKRGITIEYIQPGKPQQNAYIERDNRTVRHDSWIRISSEQLRGTGTSHEMALD